MAMGSLIAILLIVFIASHAARRGRMRH